MDVPSARPGGPGALDRLGLRLVPAHEVDAAALHAFEVANRAFFARWIPDRGEAYYTPAAVAESLVRMAGWWAEGTDRMHVVLDPAGGVAGRANLVEVDSGRASLGYRVAAAVAGAGVATAAVTDLLAAAPRWGITRVEAVTSHANVASAKVLERCGFTLVGTRHAALRVHGVAMDAHDWRVELTPSGQRA